MTSLATVVLVGWAVATAAAPGPTQAPASVSAPEGGRSAGPIAAWTVAVATRARAVEPRVDRRGEVPSGLDFEVPMPARHGAPTDGWLDDLLSEGFALDAATRLARTLPSPTLSTVFDSIDFDSNQASAGKYQVPPDVHGAVGPNHLVNVVNSTLHIHAKDGTLLHDSSLTDFFAALSPLTETFDPKVLYDPHAERWLVVTLERVDLGADAPNSRSAVLLAVSDDADPTGVWYAAELPGRFDLDRAYWTDYPGFAVDGEAIYLTGNLFAFGELPFYAGIRLWVVDKGLSNGLYAGSPADVSIVDPLVPGVIGLPGLPARVDGADATRGTWIVGYSGLNLEGHPRLQLVRVEDALTTPVLTPWVLELGPVDQLGVGLSNAPQASVATHVETNDRRTLDVVWRGDELWTVFTVNGPPGTPESGRTVAYWLRIDTSNPTDPTLADGGPIGAADLAPGAHTFFPSIAVAADGRAVIGFAASAPSLHPGAYFVTRAASDPAGTVGSTHTLRAGVDSYIRTFGGGLNRWGDYSATVLDESTGCFWIYGQYAITRGTPINGENGRWGTTWGETCPPADPSIFADGFESGGIAAWAADR